MSDQKQQTPSVGRVVHYVAHGSPNGDHQAGVHRAAIITETFARPDHELPGRDVSDTTDPTIASLCVLNPTGMYFLRQAPYDPTGTKPGSWHWPEYVPARAL